MKTEAQRVFVWQFLAGSFLETRASSAAWVATWWSWGGLSCCCNLSLCATCWYNPGRGPGVMLLCYYIPRSLAWV